MAKGFTSDFPSGHDRWLSLQQVSDRILNRAGTLNSMEKRELDRQTRQLEYSEHLKQARYDSIQKRLRGNLKDHHLYRRALRNSVTGDCRNRKSTCELPSIPPTAEMRPYGRYSGRTHSRLSSAMDALEQKMHHKEKEKTSVLLEKCRKESDVLIDRTLKTEQILAAKDLPLSERLTTTNADKFKAIIGRARAAVVLNKLRGRIAVRKEQEKGMKVQKTSRGVFQTQMSKMYLSSDD